MKNILTKILLKLLKFKPQTIGVPVIIINKGREILLGKRNENSPFSAGLWGLPGGILDYGEKLTECVKRETKEELGVVVKVVKQSKKIYETFPSKNYSFHTLVIVFYAKIVEGVPKPKDETQEVRWIKPSEIKKMKLAYNHNEILKEEGLVKC